MCSFKAKYKVSKGTSKNIDSVSSNSNYVWLDFIFFIIPGRVEVAVPLPLIIKARGRWKVTDEE